MAQADTQAYFAAMQPLIVEGLGTVAPGAATVLRACRRWDGVTDGYYQQCPPPWLEIQGTPLQGVSASLVFPQAYFNWCQRYVAAAVRNKPNPGASAEVRVVWALDVWAHIQYGLWALNLPWANYTHGRWININGGPVGDIRGATASPRNRFAQSINAFYANAEQAKRVAASVVAGDFVGQGADIEQTRMRAPVYPAPFMTITPFWVEGGAGLDQNSVGKRPNPLWALLLEAIQPWSTSQTLLPSKGNKDAGYPADAVLDRARLQWRLWSARDFWGEWGTGRTARADKTVWPYGMGTGDNCAPLDRYIAHVERESSDTIIFSGVAYPTFTASFNSIVPTLVRPFSQLNYAREIRAAIAGWVNGSTLPADFNPAAPVVRAVPVTFTDMRDLNKQEVDRATARARVAVQNPASLCEAGDTVCLEAAKAYQQSMAVATKIPLYGQVITGMKYLTDLMLQAVGGAAGWGSSPFRVIKLPFARSLSAQGYNMAPSGSSADVVFRVLTAFENTWKHAQVPAVSFVPDCEREVVQTADGNYITPCVGAAAGSTPGAPAAGQLTQLQAEQCQFWWSSFQRDFPRLAACASDRSDQFAFQMICMGMLAGKLTAQQAVLYWGQYLFQVKGCTMGAPAKPRTLLSSFVAGFEGAGHPYPTTGLYDGFISSMNPLSLFRKRAS